MGIFGGLFGRKPYMGAQIREDANAPGLQDLLGHSTGEQTQPWDAQQTMLKRPGLFGSGGKGWDIVGNTADALLQQRGGQPIYDDGSKQRLQQMILAAQIAQQQHIANRQYDAQNPLPSDFQRTLIEGGILPGSAEWIAAHKMRGLNQQDPPHLIVGPGGGQMLVGGGYGYPGQTQTPEFAGWPDEGGSGLGQSNFP